MNTLAHLHLAWPQPAWLVGALLGDAWRGRLRRDWPEGLGAGVMLHRYVDSFTDAHPVVAGARARLPPPFRRYAGILVDVWFDHCLATHAESLRLPPVSRIAADLDAALDHLGGHLPPVTLRWARALTDPERLDAYRDTATVARALRSLSGRLRRDNPLADGLPALQQHAAALDADFLAFWPQLCAALPTMQRRAIAHAG